MTEYSLLLESISQDVSEYENRYSFLSVGKAFLYWYGIVGLELSDTEAESAVSFDGGNDKSIDFFHIDEENRRVIIAQGKYSLRGTYKANEGEFLKLIHTTDWLSNPESLRREGRIDLADAAEDYKDAIARDYSVEYQYVYMGLPNKEVIDAANNFNIAHAGSNPLESARVISLDILKQIYDEFKKFSIRINEEKIQIRNDQVFQQTGPYGRAFVASLPAGELQRLYDAHGNALFDRNVRLYLGARKGSVNAGIQETLTSHTDRGNFWAYNNGITFICGSYNYDGQSGDIEVRNFSIVNGCQTTVSIAQGPRSEIGEVSVLARFIEAKNEQAVDSIIRFNNSQTPIRPWDISTQDKIQKRLKNELETGDKPYFYELRRGETREVKGDERRRFTRNGKFQVIRFDLLAQYLAAFRGLAVPAYKDKNALFDQYKHTIFPADLNAVEVIFVWQAADAIAEAVRESKKRAVERNLEERLRILNRGANILAIPVMAAILRERNGTTYLNRIRRETAASNHTRDRLDKYASIAVAWYAEIVGDLVAGGIDLTKLVRSQQLFQRVEEKVLSKWEVQSASSQWVEDALPKIQ